ncbi:MAG: type II and III secretion system protein [Gammaproteobacteria bacterium]|nr:type II and III secretion system protein [Gammaproteobacteria bacterium]
MAVVIRVVLVLLLGVASLAAWAKDPEPQISLNVRFLQVSDHFIRDIGVDWRGMELPGEVRREPAESAGKPPVVPDIGPRFEVFGPGQLERILRSLDRKADAGVISAPRVTTSTGSPAVIPATGPIRVSGQTFNDIGLRLQVTPVISQDGSIQMRVDVTNNEIRSVQAPELVTRRVTTQVVIDDGETVALGGLISEEQQEVADQIPQLGDLPLIGRLFRSGSGDKKARNLLIFVTARLIGEDGQPVRSGSAGSAAPGSGGSASDASKDQTSAGETAPGNAAAGETSTADTSVGDASAGRGSRSAGGGAPDQCFGKGELRTTTLGPKPDKLGGLVKGIAGALLGGGGGKSSSRVRTSKNPFKKAESIEHTTPDGAQFAVQARGEASKRKGPVDETLFGLRLADDTVKKQGYLFTDMMLVDPDCNQINPVERYIYKVWKKMRLTVTVSFWKWRDGQLVNHWTRSGSQQWNRLLGGGGASPTWVGARFDVSPAQLAGGGYTLVTACTVEQGNTILIKGQGYDIAGSQDQVNRVPGLSSLPTLAPLFRQSEKAEPSDELLIFMTPRIISQPE